MNRIDIANAVANSFQNYCMQTLKQTELAGLKMLKEEYQKKESEIQTLQSNVNELSKATLGGSTNQAYTEAKLKLDQLQD